MLNSYLSLKNVGLNLYFKSAIIQHSSERTFEIELINAPNFYGTLFWCISDDFFLDRRYGFG